MRAHEHYVGNLAYGYATELKRFARLPLTRSLTGLIPHGVFLSDVAHDADREAALALGKTFVYPAFLDESFSAYGRVVPIASPVAYAIERLGLTERGSGALYFPQHSTDMVRVERDTLADIESLSDDFGDDVTVCLHYQDRSRAEYYGERFAVTSISHDRLDQAWTEKMLRLMSKAEIVISDDYGSSLFYAKALGKRALIRGERPKVIRDPDFPISTSGSEKRLAYLVDVFSDADDPRQREATAEYLRLDMLKDSKGLREDLIS